MCSNFSADIRFYYSPRCFECESSAQIKKPFHQAHHRLTQDLIEKYFTMVKELSMDASVFNKSLVTTMIFDRELYHTATNSM